MTQPDTAREAVLLVADDAPHGGLDPLAWRIEQYLALFGASSDVTFAVAGPAPDDDCVYGHEVVAMGLDLDRFWRSHRRRYGIVAVVGGGTAHRAAASARQHQPHATVVVDAATLLSLERPRLPDAEVRADERGGRERIADLRRQRDAELLHAADMVWVRSEREAEHVRSVSAAAEVAVLEPPAVSAAHERGDTIAVLAAPHREFGEPDLGAVARVAAEVVPAMGADAASVRVITERAVPQWAERYPELSFVERSGPLVEELRGVGMVVIARGHGCTAWAQLMAARACGIPVVATPEAVRGLDDPTAWGVNVVAVDELAAVVRVMATRTRVPSVAPAAVNRARTLSALGLRAAVTEEAADWLCSPRLSRRHDLQRQTYLRSAAAIADDPDPDAGVDLVDRPLISVLTPVYNTPLEVLRDTVASVRTQTYERWELVLVDDHSPEPGVKELCRELAAGEPRITLVERDANGGIAAASNSALAAATGEYVALLDHDDLLRSDALLEVVRAINAFPDVDMIYSDEDKLFEDGDYDHSYAKSGWAPDLHLSYNYTCHFACFRRSVMDQVGGWRLGFDGAQDYDLALRITELSDRIVHIPRNLYHWRVIEGSTSAGVEQKGGAWDAGRRALQEAMERRELHAEVSEGLSPGTYHVGYPVTGRPTVGVIIPTRDRIKMLRAAVDDLHDRTTWSDFEVMVVNNESVEPDTLLWLERHDGPVIDYPHQFSYARMMNLAAEQIDADLLLFLNNDVEVTEPAWLESMIGYAQHRRVGAVGARLLFPDGRVQHEGVVLGVGGVAGNVDSRDYFSLGAIERNCFSLTAACLLVRPDVFWEVGGFEERLRVAFNDVDLTMRIHQLGYDLIYTPQAALNHQESASRGSLHPEEDEAFFLRRWGPWEQYDDPYYNPRLSRGVQYFFTDEIKQVWMPKSFFD